MFFNRKKTDRKRRGHRRSEKPATAAHPLEQFIVEEMELSGDAKYQQQSTGGRARRRPILWLVPARLAAGWIVLWLILVLAPLFSRHPWPPDETRVLAVVWQMWARGDVIVPMFNGAFASQPSPLLAWTIHLGWWLFGVNDWWPRLVPAVFALASMFLCAPLAHLLWPGRVDVARYVPGILLGGFFWAIYSTLLFTGMPLVFSTLLAVYALAWTWRKRDLRVWLLLGLALGLGMLSQGVMIYLYVLPLALLAPLWANEGPRPKWSYWYADIFKACLVGLAIFLAWALPLGMRAGAGSAVAALFIPLSQQTLSIFPLATPWWWYLFLLPLLGLPWFVWPLTWMRLWHMRGVRLNAGILFCMVWTVPVIALLSLFALRQPQFLLPLLPAYALVVAYLLLDENLSAHRHDTLASTMIFPMILVGGVLAVFPGLPRMAFLPDILWSVSPFVGVAIILVGIMLAWLPLPEAKQRITSMVSVVVVVSSLMLLVVGWRFDPLYDPGAVTTVLAKVQSEQRPLAVTGEYAGEFDFGARLARPMHVVDADNAALWLMQHPQGLIVSFTQAGQPWSATDLTLVYEIPYGNQAVRLWGAKPATPADGSVVTPDTLPSRGQ